MSQTDIVETDLSRRRKILADRENKLNEDIERILKAIKPETRKKTEQLESYTLSFAPPLDISVVDYVKLKEKWKKKQFELSHGDYGVQNEELKAKIDRAVDLIIKFGRETLP